MATREAVPTSIAMSTAVVVVTRACSTRGNHKRQSDSSKGNYQKTFHFRHPEVRGKEQRSLYASAVPNREADRKGGVFRCLAFPEGQKCHQIESEVSRKRDMHRTGMAIGKKGVSVCSG
tara:strand:+ start:499 stop:855 length:357 start_codon:yes stop_codon:yes gene_type:complete